MQINMAAPGASTVDTPGQDSMVGGGAGGDWRRGGRVDVPAYLARLGVEHPGAPSVEGLRRLHRAHVTRVPYETLEIQLGRRTTVDPHESAERIIGRHRGGYCFHLNGAFSLLLDALGYAVTWHKGGVQVAPDTPAPGANGNHLVLTVRGLPHRQCPDGVWLVDVGLGDALYDPLPLRAGQYPQGPFRYGLAPSRVEPGGWRFTHDRRGGFTGLDFVLDPAGPADFAEMHAHLSTAAESSFVRNAVAQRRRADGVDVLTGCRLTRVEVGEPVRQEVHTEAEWYSALARIFGLSLDDVSPAERAALWQRVRATHRGQHRHNGR